MSPPRSNYWTYCYIDYIKTVLEGLTSLGVIESPNVFRTAPRVDGDLITLTLLPRARWQTLLHLDVIAVKPYLPYLLPDIEMGTIGTK